MLSKKKWRGYRLDIDKKRYAWIETSPQYTAVDMVAYDARGRFMLYETSSETTWYQ